MQKSSQNCCILSILNLLLHIERLFIYLNYIFISYHLNLRADQYRSITAFSKAHNSCLSNILNFLRVLKKLTNKTLCYMVSYTSNEPYNQRGRGYEMKHNLNESKPIFQQIKEQIEASILNDSLQADDKAPSTNELALFHKINPATAAKGINELVS